MTVAIAVVAVVAAVAAVAAGEAVAAVAAAPDRPYKEPASTAKRTCVPARSWLAMQSTTSVKIF